MRGTLFTIYTGANPGSFAGTAAAPSISSKTPWVPEAERLASAVLGDVILLIPAYGSRPCVDLVAGQTATILPLVSSAGLVLVL